MVRNWHFHCQGPGLIPGQGTKISWVLWHSQKKFVKIFKIKTLVFFKFFILSLQLKHRIKMKCLRGSSLYQHRFSWLSLLVNGSCSHFISVWLLALSFLLSSCLCGDHVWPPSLRLAGQCHWWGITAQSGLEITGLKLACLTERKIRTLKLVQVASLANGRAWGEPSHLQAWPSASLHNLSLSMMYICTCASVYSSISTSIPPSIHLSISPLIHPSISVYFFFSAHLSIHSTSLH